MYVFKAPFPAYITTQVSTVSIAKHRQPPPGTTQDSFGGNGELCGTSDADCAVNKDGYKLLPDAV